MQILRSLVVSSVFTLGISGQAVPSANAFPTDSGVYLKSPAGEFVDIDPEIINWKTGGVAKSAFSYGIVKGDLNGHLKGPSSGTKLGRQELVVVVPDGTSITEYQLLRMHEHAKDREFRAETGGVLHKSGGADRDVVEFEHKKIASRTYLVTIPDAVKDGEYGLLPPGAVASKSATSMGKIYSFRLSRQ